MCSTKTNQRTIKIYDSNDKYLGSETFDERLTKSDINKLLNKNTLGFGSITHNIQSIGEVQTKDDEPGRFKSVANEAKCDK